MATKVSVEFTVNGTNQEVCVLPDAPLAFVLRNELGLTGTKIGCELEQCGACRVLVDGVPTYSCTTPASALAGAAVTTVEGLAGASGSSPLQQAFIDHRAAQCGYCTAGMLIAATELLSRKPRPSKTDIHDALDPHLCRCGSHPRIQRAVLAAAGMGS